jgi:hypothetical protein
MRSTNGSKVVIPQTHPANVMDATVMSFHLSVSSLDSDSSLPWFHPVVLLFNDKLTKFLDLSLYYPYIIALIIE